MVAMAEAVGTFRAERAIDQQRSEKPHRWPAIASDPDRFRKSAPCQGGPFGSGPLAQVGESAHTRRLSLFDQLGFF